jgi:hypothetical protein
MVQGTRRIEARVARHEQRIPQGGG